MDDFDPEMMREFNENMNSLNANMGSLSSTLADLARQVNLTSKAQQDASETIKEVAESLNAIDKAENQAEDRAEKASEKLAASFSQAVGAVSSFSGAVLTAQEGFGKYSTAVEGLGDAAKNAGEAFGPLGAAIGNTIAVLSKLVAVAMNQTDSQNQFVKEMNRMGAIAGTSSEALTDLARDAGYAAGELNVLSPIISQVSTGLTTFGAGTTKGTEALLKVFALTDDQERAVRRYGYSLEEAQEQQAFYIQLQRESGIALKQKDMSELAMRKSTLEYTKSLVLLSELTGKNADTLKQEQQQVAMEVQNQIANTQRQSDMNALQKQIDIETNESRRNELIARKQQLQDEEETRKAALNRFSNTLGPQFNTQLQRVLRTGAFDESTKALAMMGFQAGELKKQFENVKVDTPEYDALIAAVEQQFRDGVEGQINTFGDSIQFMGEGADGFAANVGLTNETIQNYMAMEEDRANQSEMTAAEVERSTRRGADAQKDVASDLQVFERNVRTSADNFLDSMNPFNGALTAGQLGLVALTAAAGTAALALAGMAKISGAGWLNKIPGLNKLSKMMPTKATGAGLARATNFARVGGGAVAAGAAVYGAYDEAQERRKAAQIKFLDDTRDLDLTTDKGKRLKLQAERERDQEQGEARTVGATKGTGGGVGAFGGAAMGAAIGTAIFPGIGTVIGGLIGGGLGAWAGSELGEIVGEKLTEAEFNALEVSDAEKELMSEDERKEWEKSYASAQEQIKLAQEQLDVQKQNLADAHSSGLYDHDWIGDSEVNFEVLAEMRDAGTLEAKHLEAIIAHKDIDEESMRLVQRELDKLNEIKDSTGKTAENTTEETEDEETSLAEMSQAELYEHFKENQSTVEKEKEAIAQKEQEKKERIDEMWSDAVKKIADPNQPTIGDDGIIEVPSSKVLPETEIDASENGFFAKIMKEDAAVKAMTETEMHRNVEKFTRGGNEETPYMAQRFTSSGNIKEHFATIEEANEFASTQDESFDSTAAAVAINDAEFAAEYEAMQAMKMAGETDTLGLDQAIDVSGAITPDAIEESEQLAQTDSVIAGEKTEKAETLDATKALLAINTEQLKETKRNNSLLADNLSATEKIVTQGMV